MPSTTVPFGTEQVLVSSHPDPQLLQEWDRLVRAQPAGDVAQLSGWGRLRGSIGFQPVYLLALRRGEVVGGAQLLRRRLPAAGSVGYVSNGPIVRFGIDRPAAVQASLGETLGRARLRMLFVQPARDDEAVAADLLRRGFRLSDADVAPAASLRLDLSVGEDDLRRGLSRRLRTWTNQWDHRGVTVRLGSDADLPTVTRLLADTAEHQNFTPFSATYLKVLYDELVATGDAALLLGEVDADPVAVDILTMCGDTVKVRFVGFDRSGSALRLNVPGAVRWEAIKWAKSKGYRWFDFGGLGAASAHALSSSGSVDLDTLPGADRYKLRFGGSLYRYPSSVELIPSPVVRLAYDAALNSTRGAAVAEWAKRRMRSGQRWRRSMLPRPADRASNDLGS